LFEGFWKQCGNRQQAETTVKTTMSISTVQEYAGNIRHGDEYEIHNLCPRGHFRRFVQTLAEQTALVRQQGKLETMKLPH
jgi:hypothetical protein